MWKFLKSLIPATYKIVYDPEYGFTACYSEFTGWRCIDERGVTVCFLTRAPAFDVWVKTQEQAGERINNHATSRGQKTVWSA